jgi:hypothetical protein
MELSNIIPSEISWAIFDVNAKYLRLAVYGDVSGKAELCGCTFVFLFSSPVFGQPLNL